MCAAQYNNHMKKKIGIIFLLLLAIALSAGLFACNRSTVSESQLMGKWSLTSVRISTLLGGDEVISPVHWRWLDFRGHISFNSDGSFEDVFGHTHEEGNWQVSGRNLNLNITSSTCLYLREDTYRFSVSGNTFSKTEHSMFSSRVTFYYTRAEALSTPTNLRVGNYLNWWGWMRISFVWDGDVDAVWEVQYRRAGNDEFENIFHGRNGRNIDIYSLSLPSGSNTFRVREIFDSWGHRVPELDSDFAYFQLYVREDIRLDAPQNIRAAETMRMLMWDDNPQANIQRFDAYIKTPSEPVYSFLSSGSFNGTLLYFPALAEGFHSVRVRAVGESFLENGDLVIPVSEFTFFDFDFKQRYMPLPPPDFTINENLISWNFGNINFDFWLQRVGEGVIASRWNDWDAGVRLTELKSYGLYIARFRFYPHWSMYSFVDGVLTTYGTSDFVYIYFETDSWGFIADYNIVVRTA